MTVRLLPALLLALLVLACAHVDKADAHTTSQRPKWVSRFSWAVSVCETGKGHNHPDPQHRSGSYGGAWGWYVGTWKLDRYPGMPLYPWNASLRQQYRVFLRGMARGRFWGCIEGGGYRSWM